MDADTAGGVDVTLIRWMLSLTPDQRLAVLEDLVEFLSEARVESAAGQLQTQFRPQINGDEPGAA